MIRRIIYSILIISLLNFCDGPFMSSREKCLNNAQREGLAYEGKDCLMFILVLEANLDEAKFNYKSSEDIFLKRLFWLKCYESSQKAKECKDKSNIGMPIMDK